MLREANRDGLNVTYEIDGHWNPLGHSLAATAISDWLVSKHVFEITDALAANKYDAGKSQPSGSYRDDNYLQPDS